MTDKLQEIIEHKRAEVARILPLEEKYRHQAAMRNDFRSLERALDVEPDCLALIAEVKKASPSAGVIAGGVDPVNQALLYAQAGASAISVLTDERYFQGRLDYLTRIRSQVPVPVLRKDFIIHEVQIYEAVIAGADAVLLIVAALDQATLLKLLGCAHAYQLDVLVEVHDAIELDRALDTDARIIGVNNRNLKTFAVDLHTTERLSEEVPDDILLVSESGIKTAEDARLVHSWGANAILVGETLMRADDVDATARVLMNPLGAPAS
ncbi:MAG: indole-3-glycerol phosphate synthase TrpC [Verrucomicrobiales bacterium]